MNRHGAVETGRKVCPGYRTRVWQRSHRCRLLPLTEIYAKKLEFRITFFIRIVYIFKLLNK